MYASAHNRPFDETKDPGAAAVAPAAKLMRLCAQAHGAGTVFGASFGNDRIRQIVRPFAEKRMPA